MLLTDPLCHTASTAIDASTDAVFRFLSNPSQLGTWTFGSWETRAIGDGLVEGTSLFDGGRTLVRIVPIAENGCIDYQVGRDPSRMITRISARVLDGHLMGGEKGTAFVTMTSWRTRDISDHQWRLICSAHEVEVFRLRHVVQASLAAKT
ncbi:MAG: hypothetical protein AB7O55_15950 [Lautropia sp.]